MAVSLSPSAPSLESLELFVSVVDLGSVSKAASLHRISQPSASARIQELEKLCKLKLLERTTHGSNVTDAGAEVYQLARELLECASRLMAGAETLSKQKASRLKIFASYTIAEYLIPNWLTLLKRSAPTVIPELTVANSLQVIQSVHQAGDLGFIESDDDDDQLDKVAVGSDELWVVVGKKHSWARRTRPITPPELASSSLVVRERGSGTRSIFENEMRKCGFGPLKIEAELGSTSAIKSTLICGSSAAVLSKLVVQTEVQQGSLVRVEVVDLKLTRTLYAVWSRSKGISYSERELIKVATQAEQKRR